MLKIAIIGCGKIADSHVEQIQKISGCRIVGACDKEILMAKQLYERHKIDNYFDDIYKMLECSKPDVVHVTTPPESHYDLGKICLEKGCHVYIEKPFTVHTNEARKLIEIAESNKLKITVGHDDQFTYVTRKMRKYVKDGYLGGDPIHMESYYGYDFGSEGYAKALLGDKNHWVRKLPGKLLQNVISHGICRISEYIKTDSPEVMVCGFSSAFVKNNNAPDIIDELRVIISDKNQLTAYFTFSSQIRPILHQFRIYGPKNGIFIDHDKQLFIELPGRKYKSFLEKFIPPCNFSKQYSMNFVNNIYKFAKNDFHIKSGMKYLIETFYESILYNSPVPIPYNEIILTTKIMDDIFENINNR